MDDLSKPLCWAVCFSAWLDKPETNILPLLHKCQTNIGDGLVLYQRLAAPLGWLPFQGTDSFAPLAFLVSRMIERLDFISRLLIDAPHSTMQPRELIASCHAVAHALTFSRDIDQATCSRFFEFFPVATSAVPAAALPVPPAKRQKLECSENKFAPVGLKNHVRGPEFGSFSACLEWMDTSPLHCSKAIAFTETNRKGCGYDVRRFTCSHESEYLPDVHKIGSESQRMLYKCPWTAITRTVIATGRTFLYLPRHDEALFEKIKAKSVAEFEPAVDGKESRVILKYEQQTVGSFVSESGHVHTLDGTGAKKAPSFFTTAVAETLRQCPTELDAKMRLMRRPSLAEYKHFLDPKIKELTKKAKKVLSDT